jgi:hypothetical protein
MATAERGGSAKPFEKGLSQNFKQINSPINHQFILISSLYATQLILSYILSQHYNTIFFPRKLSHIRMRDPVVLPFRK